MKRSGNNNTGKSKRKCLEEGSSGYDDHDVNSAKRYGGAAVYRTKFQMRWQQKWPFVVPVSMYCMTVSRGHQGESDIIRHIDSAQHQKNAKAMLNCHFLHLIQHNC